MTDPINESEPQPSKKAPIKFHKVFLMFFSVFGVVLTYCFFRYIYFHGMPLSDLALVVPNKALAITAVILMGSSYLVGPAAKLWPKPFSKYLVDRKYLGNTGLAAMIVHVCISLITINPHYHAKFFLPDGGFTPPQQVSFLCAAIAALHFSWIGVCSVPAMIRDMAPQQWHAVQRSGLLAFVLVLGHLGFMGFDGWWPSNGQWYGGMMPTTLVPSVFIVFVFVARALITVTGKHILPRIRAIRAR